MFLMEVGSLPVTYLHQVVTHLFAPAQCDNPDVLIGR